MIDVFKYQNPLQEYPKMWKFCQKMPKNVGILPINVKILKSWSPVEKCWRKVSIKNEKKSLTPWLPTTRAVERHQRRRRRGRRMTAYDGVFGIFLKKFLKFPIRKVIRLKVKFEDLQISPVLRHPRLSHFQADYHWNVKFYNSFLVYHMMFYMAINL